MEYYNYPVASTGVTTTKVRVEMQPNEAYLTSARDKSVAHKDATTADSSDTDFSFQENEAYASSNLDEFKDETDIYYSSVRNGRRAVLITHADISLQKNEAYPSQLMTRADGI